MELNKVYNMDCLEYMRGLEDNCIQNIITDPPYLYLDHKLDKDFNQELFFKECFRLLKDDGFLVFFGFGQSYHYWNYLCNKIGFNHKEDLIWDKGHNTSPFGIVARQHESISIFTKKDGKLNDVRIDYLEDRIANNNLQGIEQDLSRILSSFKNIKTFDDFNKFKNEVVIDDVKHGITAGKKTSKDRGCKMLETIQNGFKCKSIIRVKREHYQMEHPTAKPQKLMEMLIRLTDINNNIVYDPFSGSGSTLLKCKELSINYIGTELDKDYFNIINKRLEQVQGSLF